MEALLIQPKRHDIRPGGDGDVVFTLEAVGYGRGADLLTGVEIPQRLAGSRVQSVESALMVSREDQAARGGKQARSISHGSDLRIVPHQLAGRYLECPHVHLPGLFRALNVAGRHERKSSWPEGIGRFRVDAT